MWVGTSSGDSDICVPSWARLSLCGSDIFDWDKGAAELRSFEGNQDGLASCDIVTRL